MFVNTYIEDNYPVEMEPEKGKKILNSFPKHEKAYLGLSSSPLNALTYQKHGLAK